MVQKRRVANHLTKTAKTTKAKNLARELKLSKIQSFFLFGARGTGKSSLLAEQKFLKNALWINLLKPSQQELYALDPGHLYLQAKALNQSQWIVIDEVQKVPKLLDVVHDLIESSGFMFALTGSSARKLKAGGANLLAGRAVTFSLFPMTAQELETQFDLDQALSFGTLPKLLSLDDNKEKARFLRSYCNTYLKEEILVEQLVRKIDSFRMFLPVAAQMDGEIINTTNISKDTGVDHKTISNYFQILVDTYLGNFLNAYSRSVRKVQIQSPKFYFFDTGVKRTLEKKIGQPLFPKTPEYGRAFEAWFINECFRVNAYYELDLTFSYLKTKDGVEIDLIVEKPNGDVFLIEIKSSKILDTRHFGSLQHFSDDFPSARLICASCIAIPERIGRIEVLPWQDVLIELAK